MGDVFLVIDGHLCMESHGTTTIDTWIGLPDGRLLEGSAGFEVHGCGGGRGGGGSGRSVNHNVNGKGLILV